MPKTILMNGAITVDGTIVPTEWENYYYDDDVGVVSPRMLSLALANIEGDVSVYINSGGGSPEAAEAMRMMLVEHSGSVTIKVVGQASSAASLLAMGGDRIEMSAGSYLMIHDPANGNFGNEQEQRANAEMLGITSDAYAAVYASRSGKTQDEVRAMMRAETWLGVDDAISYGFCDGHISEASAGVSPTLMSSRTPITLARAKSDWRAAISMLARGDQQARLNSQPENPSGQSGQMNKENHMPNRVNQNDNNPSDVQPSVVDQPAGGPTPADMSTAIADALKMDRKRRNDIVMAARPHMTSGAVTEEFVDGLIAGDDSLEMASKKILDKLSSGQPDINMNANGRGNVVGRDLSREGRVDGLGQAMAAKLRGEDPTDAVATRFAGLSFVEMAAVSMDQPLPNFGTHRSREGILMDAMHASGDFPHIVAGAVNAVMETQIEEFERTFTQVAHEMTFNDFKPHSVGNLDGFPMPQSVNEAGEIKFGTVNGGSETIALGAFASGLSISRQAMVNDDVGAIQEMLDNAAMVIPEFEEQTFWELYLSNSILQDKKSVFHASRKNTMGASPINLASLSAGRALMRQFKRGEHVVRNNAPSILLCGPLQQASAEQFVASVHSTKAEDVNPWSGKLKVVVTEQIQDWRWDLLVDPQKRTRNFRYGWLEGNKAPRIRLKDAFGTQGIQMTLEHDFTAGAVNYRGGVSNPGSDPSAA